MTTSESWLVTGASGLLGRRLCADLLAEGHPVYGVRREHPVPDGVREIVADLSAPVDAGRLLDLAGASHVVHAAALTDVDRCETHGQQANHMHNTVTATLADAAAARRAQFVMISTDQLWSILDAPADERLLPDPVNVYGRTKAAGESAALAHCPSALVVRTNFFGHGTPCRPSPSDLILDAVRGSGSDRGFADVWFTPIALPLLCGLLLRLVAGGAAGIVHLAGAERLSKLDFARRLATHVGLPADRVDPGSGAAARLAAARPADMSLNCERAERLLGTGMPTLDQSLEAAYPT
jgi:dTDP-4-dehydrorhamnose reductase